MSTSATAVTQPTLLPLAGPVTSGIFWATINASWTGIPGHAEARNAFVSADHAVREQAGKDLNAIFGQKYKNLIRGLSLFDEAQLAAWGEHWDDVFQEIWHAGEDAVSDVDCYDEGGEVIYLCAFIIGIGTPAFEAFCERPLDYMNYSFDAVYENDTLDLTGVAKRVKAAREASKAKKEAEKKAEQFGKQPW